MALLRVDATPDGPRLHHGGRLETVLAETVRTLPAGAPVVVMVHGFKFTPFEAQANPHRHIFSLTPDIGCWKAVSWPEQLGFSNENGGLCVAFGWPARGSIWQAWRQAPVAARALADLVALLWQQTGTPVDMVAHSLGARVCLAALQDSPAYSVGRMVLMAAAEYSATARQALETEAARTAEVLNIITRENDVYDSLIEWLLPAPQRGDRVLGSGLSHPNWLDVQIDAPRTRRALSMLGADIAGPDRRICHWSGYLRPGALRFYGDLLRDRRRLSLRRLRQVLPPETDPRWTRLMPGLANADRVPEESAQRPPHIEIAVR